MGPHWRHVLDDSRRRRAGRADQRAKTEIASGKLATLALGDVAHYTHRKHLAESTVEGRAVRVLCGVFFVPIQDHAKFDPCPEGDRVRETIPETTVALD